MVQKHLLTAAFEMRLTQKNPCFALMILAVTSPEEKYEYQIITLELELEDELEDKKQQRCFYPELVESLRHQNTSIHREQHDQHIEIKTQALSKKSDLNFRAYPAPRCLPRGYQSFAILRRATPKYASIGRIARGVEASQGWCGNVHL